MPTVIRKAEATDTTRLAAALAGAFLDDPVMTWLLPGDERRARRLPVLFQLILRYLHLPHEEVYTTAEVSGGALWAPPDQWQTPPVSLLRSLPRLSVTLGLRMPLALRTIVAMEKSHPRQAHWYLAVLGTEPASQGKGIGSALMLPVLQRCDREGVPAYLESSKESNIAFYSRHGFEVTGTIDLPGGGPRVWPMWREPRP
jgi:ribosomal protein S18 acetylase RimI-like enzyme